VAGSLCSSLIYFKERLLNQLRDKHKKFDTESSLVFITDGSCKLNYCDGATCSCLAGGCLCICTH